LDNLDSRVGQIPLTFRSNLPVQGLTRHSFLISGLGAKAADREQAKELRVVLEQFVQTARQLDEALADVAVLGRNLHQIQARMRELNAPVPNAAQLDSLGYRCLLTACAATAWHRHFEVLAPHERRSFSALIDIWNSTNQKHLASRIGDEQTNKPEAA
jgi:hypothetical protein